MKIYAERKYEISTEEFEFFYTGGDRSEKDIEEMFFKETTHEPTVVGVYDTKEEAYEAMKEYSPETICIRGLGSSRYLRCFVVMMDEILYDEDDEIDEINTMEIMFAPFITEA